MNFITEKINQLKSNEYYVRFPELLDKSPKKHVLFLAPYANATGLYRVMLPAREINKTNTHLAIINQLIPYDISAPQKKINEVNWHLSDELIAWADYIVFPTCTSPIQDHIKMLRSVNKKSHLQFVMDIDDNYHIPNPQENAKTALISRKNLLENMASCDIITCTNQFLGNFYLNLLNNDKYKLPAFFVVPNFMSDAYLKDIQITKPKSQKQRCLISLNPTQWNDVFPLNKTFKEINKAYPNLELCLFGWNGKIGFKDAFDKVKVTLISPVPIDKYFNELANHQFDFALMPLQENDFNASKSHHKLLQYGQMGIAASVSDVLPYSEILASEGGINNTQFLPAIKIKQSEDILKAVDFYVTNTEAKNNIINNAKVYVNQYHKWENKPNYLQNVYK